MVASLVEPPRIKSAEEVGASTATPQCPQRAGKSDAAPGPIGISFDHERLAESKA